MKVFLINGILLTIGSFLLRGIGMSFQIYISNKIGAEGIGVYQLILSVFLFSVTLASSGINLASTRIVSEELAKNDISGSQKAIKHCIIYSFLMGFIAFCILFFSADIIAKFSFHGKVSGFIHFGRATAGYGKHCNGILFFQRFLAFGKIYREKTQ